MKILEITASLASIISLIISILYWQGDTQTQKYLAIIVFVIFIIATVTAIWLHKKSKIAKTISSVDNQIDYNIFELNNPYPIGFNTAKLGNHISLLQTLYPEPQGHLSNSASDNTFSVEIKKGLFLRIVYYHSGTGNDPKIRQITFWFRDELSAQKIRREALFFLGTENVETKTLGKVLEWKNVEGVRVQIDMKTYSILTPYNF